MICMLLLFLTKKCFSFLAGPIKLKCEKTNKELYFNGFFHILHEGGVHLKAGNSDKNT